MCQARKRRHWLGRMAAEAYTAKFTRFVTLTYDDDHVEQGQGLPEAHAYKYNEVRRRKHKFKHFTVGEYGDKTGRPHWHAIQFYSTCPPEPHTVSAHWYGWAKGNSCYEPLRSIAGSTAYLYDYIDKGGKALRPSNHLGLTYLLRWAKLQAQHRRPLNTKYGIAYTVPGVVDRDGKHWVYHIPNSHHYAPLIANEYIATWCETHSDTPNWDNLRRIEYDG